MTLRLLAGLPVVVLMFCGGTAIAQAPLPSPVTTAPMVEYATNADVEISEVVATLSALVNEHTADSDVGILECLKARLAEAKRLQEANVETHSKLTVAFDDGKKGRMNHEFRMTAVALAQARDLLALAQKCLDGEVLGETSTLIDVFIKTGEDVEDADEDIDWTIDIGTTPPCSSPC